MDDGGGSRRGRLVGIRRVGIKALTQGKKKGEWKFSFLALLCGGGVTSHHL